MIISIFAGRAGDTGRDPVPQFKKSISLAKKLLNWSPKTTREEGMKKTFNYFKRLSQEKLYVSTHKDFLNHIKR